MTVPQNNTLGCLSFSLYNISEQATEPFKGITESKIPDMLLTQPLHCECLFCNKNLPSMSPQAEPAKTAENACNEHCTSAVFPPQLKCATKLCLASSKPLLYMTIVISTSVKNISNIFAIFYSTSNPWWLYHTFAMPAYYMALMHSF